MRMADARALRRVHAAVARRGGSPIRVRIMPASKPQVLNGTARVRRAPELHAALRKKACEKPSTRARRGGARRGGSRSPTSGKRASYEAGSAYKIQPYIRSNSRAVDRSLALKIRYSVSDGPRGHCTARSFARIGAMRKLQDANARCARNFEKDRAAQ
jgi:hypothetical protein